MNPRARTIWFLVIATLAVGFAVWLAPGFRRSRTVSRPTASREAAVRPESESAGAIRTAPAPAGLRDSFPLENAAVRLNASSDAVTARSQLAELRAALNALPPDAAVAEIRRVLDSRLDAPTHLGFKVGGGGLEEAPTLRTFLLDELGRRDSAAAAEYARIILASKDSPDEWAVALRNLAQGDASAEARLLLQQKTEELLRHEPWQQNPSVGYLEAFDAAVFVGGTNLMPALSALVTRKDNPAVAHASFLALDRLVINDPAGTLAALQSNFEWMNGREQTRANYFARADVRDARQRQVLEEYVASPALSPMELETFTGIFPNANFMISPNLLTQNQTPDRASLVGRDAESLRVVEQWLQDPRFANRRAALQKIATRLQEFMRQANAGR